MLILKHISHKPMLAGIAIVVFTLGLAQCAYSLVSNSPPFGIPASTPMEPVVVAHENFTIELPQGWTINTNPPTLRRDPTLVADVVAAKIQGTGPSVEIRRGQQAYESLEEIVIWGEELARKKNGYYEVALSLDNINGRTTFQRIYTWVGTSYPWSRDPLRQCRDSYRLENGIGFILTFCADESDYHRVEAVFKKMSQSFQYLE